MVNMVDAGLNSVNINSHFHLTGGIASHLLIFNNFLFIFYIINLFIPPMPGRRVIFANNEYYHIFNRGINHQKIFNSKKDYERFVFSLNFYRFLPQLKLSYFLKLPDDKKNQFWEKIKKSSLLVKIVAFVLMSNHFHLLLQQINDNGITIFLSNLTNSYTRYFNLKYHRKGDLFEGVFKAVRIETEEQLIHVSRYIHINPVVSYLIKENDLLTYPWSSLPDYLTKNKESFVFKDPIFSRFKTAKSYQKFVFDQIDYGKKLEKIKHLLIENH